MCFENLLLSLPILFVSTMLQIKQQSLFLKPLIYYNVTTWTTVIQESFVKGPQEDHDHDLTTSLNGGHLEGHVQILFLKQHLNSKSHHDLNEPVYHSPLSRDPLLCNSSNMYKKLWFKFRITPWAKKLGHLAYLLQGSVNDGRVGVESPFCTKCQGSRYRVFSLLCGLPHLLAYLNI